MSHKISWAAGLFDGEGSIGYSVPKGKSGRVWFAVTQKTPEVLYRFVESLGFGNVTGPYPNGEGELYKVGFSGASAIKAMRIMWPYLSAPKKECASRAVLLHNAANSRVKYDPLTMKVVN